MYTKDLMQDEISLHGHEIGDFSYGKPQVLSWGEGRKLVMGRFCSISSGVTIVLGGNHRADWVTTYPFSAFPYIWPEAEGVTGHPTSNGDVRIGNDVWLGLSCTVLSGVTIGDGAIIGAFSLVTKDVPPYAIVGGNPAKIIRYRFDAAVIARLLTVKWWDWPETRIKEMMPKLISPDITAFLDEVLGQTGEPEAKRLTSSNGLRRLLARLTFKMSRKRIS